MDIQLSHTPISANFTLYTASYVMESGTPNSPGSSKFADNKQVQLRRALRKEVGRCNVVFMRARHQPGATHDAPYTLCMEALVALPFASEEAIQVARFAAG